MESNGVTQNNMIHMRDLLGVIEKFNLPGGGYTEFYT